MGVAPRGADRDTARCCPFVARGHHRHRGLQQQARRLSTHDDGQRVTGRPIGALAVLRPVAHHGMGDHGHSTSDYSPGDVTAPVRRSRPEDRFRSPDVERPAGRLCGPDPSAA